MNIEALDYVASSVVVLALWNVQKNRNWWFIHCVACLTMAGIMYHKELFGNMMMCTILGITAIKNYRENTVAVETVPGVSHDKNANADAVSRATNKL